VQNILTHVYGFTVLSLEHNITLHYSGPAVFSTKATLKMFFTYITLEVSYGIKANALVRRNVPTPQQKQSQSQLSYSGYKKHDIVDLVLHIYEC